MYDLRVDLATGSFVEEGDIAALVAAIPSAASITGIEERLIIPTQVDASSGDAIVLSRGEITGSDFSNGGPEVGSHFAHTGRLLTADDAGQPPCHGRTELRPVLRAPGHRRAASERRADGRVRGPVHHARVLLGRPRWRDVHDRGNVRGVVHHPRNRPGPGRIAEWDQQSRPDACRGNRSRSSAGRARDRPHIAPGRGDGAHPRRQPVVYVSHHRRRTGPGNVQCTGISAVRRRGRSRLQPHPSPRRTAAARDRDRHGARYSAPGAGVPASAGKRSDRRPGGCAWHRSGNPHRQCHGRHLRRLHSAPDLADRLPVRGLRPGGRDRAGGAVRGIGHPGLAGGAGPADRSYPAGPHRSRLYDGPAPHRRQQLRRYPVSEPAAHPAPHRPDDLRNRRRPDGPGRLPRHHGLGV